MINTILFKCFLLASGERNFYLLLCCCRLPLSFYIFPFSPLLLSPFCLFFIFYHFPSSSVFLSLFSVSIYLSLLSYILFYYSSFPLFYRFEHLRMSFNSAKLTFQHTTYLYQKYASVVLIIVATVFHSTSRNTF